MLQVLPAAPQPTGYADLGGVLLQAGRDYQANAIRKEQEAQQIREEQMRQQNALELQQGQLQNNLQLQSSADAAALARAKVENGMRLDNEKSLMDLKNREQILNMLQDKGYLTPADLQGSPEEVTAAITTASLKFQHDIDEGREAGKKGMANAQAQVDALAARNQQLQGVYNNLTVADATPLPVEPPKAAIDARAKELAQQEIDQKSGFLGIKLHTSPDPDEIAKQVPAATMELSAKLQAAQSEAQRQRKVLGESLKTQLVDNATRMKELSDKFRVAPSATAVSAGGPSNLMLANNGPVTSGAALTPAGAQQIRPVVSTANSLASFLAGKVGGSTSGTITGTTVIPSNLQRLSDVNVDDPRDKQMIQTANAGRAMNLQKIQQAPVDAVRDQLAEVENAIASYHSTTQTAPVNVPAFGGMFGNMSGPSKPAQTDQAIAQTDQNAAQISGLYQKRAQLKQQLQSLQAVLPQQNVNPMVPLTPTPAQPVSQSNLTYATPGVDDYAPVQSF